MYIEEGTNCLHVQIYKKDTSFSITWLAYNNNINGKTDYIYKGEST